MKFALRPHHDAEDFFGWMANRRRPTIHEVTGIHPNLIIVMCLLLATVLTATMVWPILRMTFQQAYKR